MKKKTLSFKNAINFSFSFIKGNPIFCLFLFIFNIIFRFVISINFKISINNKIFDYASNNKDSIGADFMNKFYQRFSFPFNVGIANIKISKYISLSTIASLFLLILNFLIIIFIMKLALSWMDNRKINMRENLTYFFKRLPLSEIFIGSIIIFGLFYICSIITTVTIIAFFVLLFKNATLFDIYPIIPLSFAILFIFSSTILPLYLLISRSLFPFIILDKNLIAIDSIRKSMKLTKGVKWSLTGYFLLFYFLYGLFFLSFLMIGFLKISNISLFFIEILLISSLNTLYTLFLIFTFFHLYRQLSDQEA